MVSLTKITVPLSSDILPRERLFRLLDASLRRPAVWVTGPAGSGKTTLVASYLEARKIPCLWYEADSGDGDIATFFYYMGLAAKKAAPRSRTPLPLLTPEYLMGIPVFARRYFEALYGKLKSPFAIVLDNYQEVPAASLLHEVVSIGLSVVPEGISLIVLSRNPVPAACARLLANNRISRLGWDDLRLTEEESGEIARMRAGQDLTPETLAFLHEKTEGWVAGLVLLIEGSKLPGHQLPDSFTPGETFGYFAAEVFKKTDPEEQRFLLATAFLPSMTARQAEALTENRAAGSILRRLTERSYFTNKHPTGDPAYSYHPLFREFLLSKAHETFSPEEIRTLRRKAALLLIDHGKAEDGALLFAQGEDWRGLVSLILSQAPSLVSRGRSRTLEEWIGRLPERMVAHTPWLLYWKGICLVPAGPARGGIFLEKAFRIFETQHDDTGTFLAWSGVVQTILFEFHDFTLLDTWIGWLDERASRGITYPTPEIAATVTAAMTAALAWRMPSHPRARAWVNATWAPSQAGPHIDTLLRVYTNSAFFHMWMGEYAECGMLLDRMKRIVQSGPASPVRQIVLKVVEAMFCNSSVELKEQAGQAVLEGLEIADQSGVHIMDTFLYFQGVASSLNDANKDKAREFLSKVEKTITVGRSAHSSSYYYFLSWYSMLANDLPRAIAVARESLRLNEEGGLPVSEVLIRLVLALALDQSGNREEAAGQLETAEKASSRTNSSYCAYLCDMTHAYLSLTAAEGCAADDEEGLEALRRALVLGRRKGYTTMTYFWRPKIFGYLGARALGAGMEVEYVKDLIHKLGLKTSMVTPALIEHWPWPVRVYTLGRFEVLKDGKPLEFSAKAPRRTISFLKLLLSCGRNGASEEHLADTFWPDTEGERASNPSPPPSTGSAGCWETTGRSNAATAG